MSDRPLSIMFLVTEDWYFWSHRKDLARKLLAHGYDVFLGTRAQGELVGRIEDCGIKLKQLPFRRSLRNPILDILASIKMLAAIHSTKPDVVHFVALKPVLLGFISVLLLRKVVFVHAIAGFGYIFTANSSFAVTAKWIVNILLRTILRRRNSFVLVQNLDDKLKAQKNFGLAENKVFLIPGSGVDTERFSPTLARKYAAGEKLLVVLPARMLFEKGCREFVAAAEVINKKDKICRFALVGGVDFENPGGIPKKQIDEWVSTEIVEWWGHVEDMAEVYNQADIVCLPSYGEGLPKALLEAAACGKPLVATDVPGCRDICVDKKTGITVRPKDVTSLVSALGQLLDDAELRERYGHNARAIVVSQFSLEQISKQTIVFYNEITK